MYSTISIESQLEKISTMSEGMGIKVAGVSGTISSRVYTSDKLKEAEFERRGYKVASAWERGL